MDTESSSRSPDSSCPDYFPSYDLAPAIRNQSSSRVDVQMNSSIENDDLLNSTVYSSASGLSHLNSVEAVPNFPPVESQWNGSSSATNHLGGFLPSSNYQNSSTSSRRIGIDTFYKSPTAQVHTNHNPPSYSKPEMPYFASSSTPMLSAKATPQPKLEHSNASSSSDSNYLSIPTSNTVYENSTRQLKKYEILKIRTPPPIFSSTNLSHRDTLHTISHVPQHHASSYNSNPQLPEISAKHPCMGLKRKAPVFNNSNDLLSAPSSSNFARREQSISNESKKNKPNSCLSYLGDDDEIQIIIPDTSYSSTSASSLSAGNHHRRTVISSHGSLSASNSSAPTTSEHNHSPFLDNQSSSQATQESFSTLHNPLSSVNLDQMLDSVWPDLDEIASSANIISTADSTAGIESDDSSSSSIISIHEVVKETSSLQNSKPGSPVLKEAPSNLPTLITLDNSPKNDEFQESLAKAEAENVKEGFKKLIEDELICNICTEVLIKPITLGCSHTFCKYCISEWKDKKRQCPMCRASIETETPCLFLDNFISKAVEQLDPASVEKRLEIIKSREEEQKKKTSKLSAQQPPSSNMPPRLNPRQVLNLLTSTPLTPSYRNLIGRSVMMAQVRERRQQQHAMLAQIREHRQQYMSISRHSSNIPQASPNIPQISSDITQPSSNVSDIPSLSLGMFQSTPDITPFSHQFYQSSVFPHGPPNGYFY